MIRQLALARLVLGTAAAQREIMAAFTGTALLVLVLPFIAAILP